MLHPYKIIFKDVIKYHFWQSVIDKKYPIKMLGIKYHFWRVSWIQKKSDKINAKDKISFWRSVIDWKKNPRKRIMKNYPPSPDVTIATSQFVPARILLTGWGGGGRGEPWGGGGGGGGLAPGGGRDGKS